MFRGFTTINFFVDDVVAASRWYADLLGIEPYFIRPSAEEPAYVEFRIGDAEDELGLIDSSYRPAGLEGVTPAGAVMHWHVDDVPAAIERLESMGAQRLEGPIDREAGFVTASVVDPFGNVLGLMYSPHYLEKLGQGGGGVSPRDS